jgi:hypothetical protein
MAATIAYVYLEFISLQFAYLGYGARQVDTITVVALVLVAPLSALALPARAENPSQFLLALLYYFLILPSLVIPPLHANLDATEGFVVSGLVMAAFLLMVVGANVRLRVTPPVRIAGLHFWIAFGAIWLGLNILVLVGFAGNIRLVGFEDLYAQRELVNKSVRSGWAWYASGFLANAFNPFLVSYGLATRRWWLVLLGVAAQVFLFATAAQKIVLVTVPLIIAFFLLVFDRKRFSLVRVGGFSVLVSIGFLPMLFLVTGAGAYEDLLRNLIALVYLRTFCTTGAMVAVYADYFQTHPWTHYSHSLVGAPFSTYPYDAPLGEVVGDFVTGGMVYVNANAGFFATDGFAALGGAGVLLIGAIVAAFLAAIAMLLGDKRLPVMCGTLLPYGMGLANTSFFTSLLTGGGFVAVLLLVLWSWTDADQAKQH